MDKKEFEQQVYKTNKEIRNILTYEIPLNILSANYTKLKEMKEEIFNAQKGQTYWGYKEILQAEEFRKNVLVLPIK